MSKRWISLGEIYVEPDGGNLFPHATYPVIERDSTLDQHGRILHRVVYQDTEIQEERYYSHDTPYLRSVEVPVERSVVTLNSPSSRWLLLSDEILLERVPYGDALIDIMTGAREDIDIDGDELRRLAAREALGNVYRSIFGTFRPVVDDHGNLMVNPRPVSVGKTA